MNVLEQLIKTVRYQIVFCFPEFGGSLHIVSIYVIAPMSVLRGISSYNNQHFTERTMPVATNTNQLSTTNSEMPCGALAAALTQQVGSPTIVIGYRD